MSITVTILSPGQMGAGVGRRLVERGARVLTSLAGRSEASVARVREAGLTAVDDDAQLAAEAQLVLSIVPPGEALALAERLRPALARAPIKPVYVECNAVAPATARQIEAALSGTGCPFVDGGIIGGPPTPGDAGPRLYISGPAAEAAMPLAALGLDVRRVEGPVGAASALKMSYASLSKGLTAIGTAMMLSAGEAGVAGALYAELADSQPMLLSFLTRAVPRMVPKAYRWVAEMEEIASFLGGDSAEAQIFLGAARLYERLAGESGNGDIATLDRFLAAARRP
jgi:putative dehydrogenase